MNTDYNRERGIEHFGEHGYDFALEVMENVTDPDDLLPYQTPSDLLDEYIREVARIEHLREAIRSAILQRFPQLDQPQGDTDQ